MDRGAGVAGGAALDLPGAWTDDPERRRRARIPAETVFREKWRLALQLLRQVRAAGLKITAVVADAGYGDITVFRRCLHRLTLPYALGISSTLTAFLGTPAIDAPLRGRVPRRRRAMLVAPHERPFEMWQIAAALPAAAWRRVTWRQGTQPPRAARCAAVRVTPAQEWRDGRLAPEVWLLCERPEDAGEEKEKDYFINLPPQTSLTALVRLAHQRGPIEQQYQQLKTELGLDHFQGRTWPGWHHHVVLHAVAYAFLQKERMHREPALTFEAIRAIVQEVFVGLLFAARPRYAAWLREARQLLPLRL